MDQARTGVFPKMKISPSSSRCAELTTWSWGARFQSTPINQTLFNSTTFMTSTQCIPRHTASKLMRWTLKLSAFSICCRALDRREECVGGHANAMGSLSKVCCFPDEGRKTQAAADGSNQPWVKPWAGLAYTYGNYLLAEECRRTNINVVSMYWWRLGPRRKRNMDPHRW